MLPCIISMSAVYQTVAIFVCFVAVLVRQAVVYFRDRIEAGGGSGQGVRPLRRRGWPPWWGLALGMAPLNQYSYKEISWKEFVGSYLFSAKLKKLGVINNK